MRIDLGKSMGFLEQRGALFLEIVDPLHAGLTIRFRVRTGGSGSLRVVGKTFLIGSGKLRAYPTA